MKPIKVICPICGEEMIPKEWGKKRDIYANINGQTFAANYSINYVDYVCPCGNKMEYKGIIDCWQKKCRCDNLKCAFCNKKITPGELRYKTCGNNTVCENCKNKVDDDE